MTNTNKLLLLSFLTCSCQISKISSLPSKLDNLISPAYFFFLKKGVNLFYSEKNVYLNADYCYL